MAPLTVTELEALAALMKQQAEKRFAPMVQTAPAPKTKPITVHFASDEKEEKTHE